MTRVVVCIVSLSVLLSCCRGQGGSVESYEPIKQDAETSIVKDTVLHYAGFTTQYNPATLQPDWVMYTLTAQQVEMTKHTPKVDRDFQPDPYLKLPQASNDDYRNSGWVRGHMARRQDMKWSKQSVRESDYFTNICPQNKEMNNGVWLQIEDKVRKIAEEYDSVVVVCGPIFTNPDTLYIGPNRVAVPDYFFKTLLIKDVKGYHAIAFLCPNNGSPLSIDATVHTVDEVESISKIDVYAYLPDKIEEAVECTLDLQFWGI